MDTRILPGFWEKLEKILYRYGELERLMSETQKPDPREFAQWSKEYTNLIPLEGAIRTFQDLQKEQEDLQAMLQESGMEGDFAAMAKEEEHDLLQRLSAQEVKIRMLLLPPDEDDTRNAILEIRAGTGGEEAALFAADLMRMYRRYAESKRWVVEVLHVHESDTGGLKEGSFSLTGPSVFARLKFEAGVHRVQRVPATEASGRIHTSAATVAVLPEAEEVDIQIEEKDLRIDVFRSSGPGGQSVNTTDSGVRITHLPTGVVVQQQDEKSQHKNKAKAMKILRSRLYDQKQQEEIQSRSLSRQSQIGRGDRSERIRTYNFPQGRVTDHRVKVTVHNLSEILEGQGLDAIIDALQAEDQAQRLIYHVETLSEEGKGEKS